MNPSKKRKRREGNFRQINETSNVMGKTMVEK